MGTFTFEGREEGSSLEPQMPWAVLTALDQLAPWIHDRPTAGHGGSTVRPLQGSPDERFAYMTRIAGCFHPLSTPRLVTGGMTRIQRLHASGASAAARRGQLFG